MNFIQRVSYTKEWKANINVSFLLDSANGSQRMAKLHISIREITMCHFGVFMIHGMVSKFVWLLIFFRSFVAFSHQLAWKPFCSFWYWFVRKSCNYSFGFGRTLNTNIQKLWKVFRQWKNWKTSKNFPGNTLF